MTQPHFPISASSVRFIKLGPGGRWESKCIKEKHILRFGYESGHEGQLEDMRHGRWDKIRTDWLPKNVDLHDRKAKQKATVATNALRVFYEDDGTTLWVTFYLGSLYWCFLEPGKPIPIAGDPEQTSYRSVRGRWSNLDAHGLALRRETLPGSINAVSMFRATTCVVDDAELLLRRINGQRSEQSQRAENARDHLIEEVRGLIRQLQWQDFEVLADLLMTAGGWRRTDRLGGAEKTVDLKLEFPLTGERAFAQVKARATQAVLDKYVNAAADKGERMFFVHNSDRPLTSEDCSVYVLGRDEVSRLIVKFGLVDWLIDKTR